MVTFVHFFSSACAVTLADTARLLRLRGAAMQALRVPRETCLELAARHGWASSAAQFYGHIRRVAREAGYFPREPEPATSTTLTAFASGRGGEGRGLPQRLPA